MIKFEKEKVLLLHQMIAQEMGGAVGVRDMGLLESALENAYLTYDGEELYKTKEEKAARLGYSLISNHAFVDGNKRIGVYVMLTFLEVNGIRMNPTNEDVINLGLKVASGEMKYDEILDWVNKHKKKCEYMNFQSMIEDVKSLLQKKLLNKENLPNYMQEKTINLILEELDYMLKIRNINLFYPTYPIMIVDSWDYSDVIGTKLLELLDIYKKL